jgi:hypothetical protein
MTDVIALVRTSGGLTPEVWTDDRISAVLNYVTGGGTAMQPHEAAAFLHTADKYDLDPVLGEIWPIPTKKGIRSFTGRDGWLKVATRDDRYEAHESGCVFENDDFKVVKRWDAENGKAITSVEHEINGFDRGNLVGAYCVVYHGGRSTVALRTPEHYAHLISNTKREVWQKDPEGMLENRAITHAFRRSVSIAGLFIEGEEGEFDQTVHRTHVADRATAAKMEDLRAELEILEGVDVPEAEVVPPEEEPAVAEDQDVWDLRHSLSELLQAEGIPWAALIGWTERTDGVPDDVESWDENNIRLALVAAQDGGIEILREYALSLIGDSSMETLELESEILNAEKKKLMELIAGLEAGT